MKRGVLFVIIFNFLNAQNQIIDLNLSSITESVSKKIGTIIKDNDKKEVSFQTLYKEEFNSIWDDIIKKLQDAVELEKEKAKAPNSAIFSKDKNSIQKDINEIFDDILKEILDGDIFEYRKDLATLQDRIDSLEKKILEYREKRVIAPTTSIIATTKSGYDKKIQDAQKEIKSAKESIKQIKNRLSQSLKFVGINLTPAQIDVLLSRVDGDDIIKMTLTLKVLKDITKQLSEIMQESSKNLKYAKKYYGMHMVLVEMVAWIQQKLIQKYNSEYIPKVDKIIDESEKMMEKTKELIKKETDANRLKVYKQNLLAQSYTNKIAKRYKRDLIQKLNQLKKSYQITLDDLKLAKNTYKTVTLSDELFRVITDSQKVLDAVIKLQVPKIIPFDSQIVKDKYKEITKQIQRESSL